MSEIKIDEIDTVLDMYHETRKSNECLNSVKDFCEQYLERCQCCGCISYHDELVNCEDWRGSTIKCCDECKRVLDEDRLQYGYDEWDLADELCEERKLGLI